MKKITNRSLIEGKINLLKETQKVRNLTIAEHEELSKLTKKLAHSKRGAGSKRKGATYERKIAKLFKEKFNIDLVRTPQSGGFAKKSSKADAFRGDVTTVDNDIEFRLHLECKDQKTWKLRDWLNQAEEDCPSESIPVVVFHKQKIIENGKQLDKSGDYVALRLEDFMNLVHREDIVKEVK